MMPLSKMKYRGNYICREYSQVEHIKIWKKIDQYLQRYNQFTKICWRHNMQIKTLSSEAIMMTSWVNWGSNDTWNHISNSCFFQPWYKSWGQLTIWRAILIFKISCFWSNLHYISHSSTRGFWTLTRAHGLMKGQEWLKIM